MEVYFPALAVAARRLRLDDAELAEAVLHAVGTGHSEQEAITMTLRESLQRQGKYHGVLKTLVDSGAVFQLMDDTSDAEGTEGLRELPMASERLDGGLLREQSCEKTAPLAVMSRNG